MSSTTITNNPHEVAEDFNVSFDLPLRLKSSLRQNKVFITPSVCTSSSSVDDLARTSVTSSDQEDTDATSVSDTIFGISFPYPPPNTPSESSDGISVSSQASPKSGWTGEYSDPGISFTSMSKLGWTGEYSTSGVEPEDLMARLSTLANTSEDEPDKAQSGEEGVPSGGSSSTQGGGSAFTARDISPEEGKEVAKLARQAISGMTPRSVMESLDIKQVKSSVVTITNSVAQPQSAVIFNIEDESVPKAAEAVVPSPTEAKSTTHARFVKREDSYIGCMGCCMSFFKTTSKPKPQVPVNQPKHATLSPTKSCLKPNTSLAGTGLDRIEEDSPLQSVPAPKPSKGARVTFELDETAESEKSKPKPKPKSKSKSKSKSYFKFNLFSKTSYEETQDTSDEEEELDPDSPFAAQDLEIQRRLARADVYRDANERASIIRGALDFLLVVSDRVDCVAADRISILLDKTGHRCLGSYTGEEKDHVNPHQYGNIINQKLYRSKETAMSYKRRRQSRNTVRLGAPWM